MRLPVVALSAIVLLAGCLSLPRESSVPRPAGDEQDADAAPSYVVFGQRYYPMSDATGYRARGVASWYGAKFHGRDTSSGERYDMYGMTAAHKTLPLPSWVRVTNLRNNTTVLVKVNDRGPFVKNRLIDLSYEAARRLDMIGDGTTLVEIEVIPAPAAVAVSAAVPTAQQSPGTVADAAATEADVIESLAYDTAPADPSLPPAGTPADVAVAASAPPAVSTPAASDLAGIGQLFVQVGAFGDLANAQRMREALYNADIENVRLANAESNGLPIFRVQVGPVIDVAEYDILIARLETLGISETHLITE